MLSKLINSIKSRVFILLIVPMLFLFAGIATLKDYGVNWDSFVHFSRGQAYLNFFLTGNKNYANLPQWKVSGCAAGNLGLLLPVCPGGNPRRSYFQSDYYNYDYWVNNDGGHPPLNDILASFSNYIFYQKLGLISDTLSYHLFIIFAGFLLVATVSFFVGIELGIIPGVVASIVLASYPLFFAESHFNIKDPVEASFFGLTLIFFYWGMIKNKWKYILFSSLAAGLALGTKLNIVFAAFIAAPWVLFYLLSQFFPKFSFKKVLNFFAKRKAVIFALVIYLPISFGIVYTFWPYLWQDPLRNVFNIFGYYAQIGTGTPADVSKFIFHGWDFYPFYWIIVTTSIPVLILTLLGILSLRYFVKIRKTGFYLFIFLWLIIPIIRASWPGADIYGGVRQLMEYIPALAIFAGMGVFYLVGLVKKYDKKLLKIVYLIVLIGLLFSVYEVCKIHPNENVYFNELAGGLTGARDKNIPYWGNTYGNVYLQGVKWLNDHAEQGAKIALPVGVMSNIPRTMFRPDLDFSKPNWTGPNRGGEYGIEMYFDWPAKYWYSFQYYDEYLDPIYVYSVDGVPLLKIWKNDLEHTKPGFKKESEYFPKNIVVEKNVLGPSLKIDLGNNIHTTKLIVRHDARDCQNGPLGYVALSSDGKTWEREPDPITGPQVAPGVDGSIIGWSDTNFVYLFAGKTARFIMLDPQIVNSCLLKNHSIQVFGLTTSP